MDYVFKTMEGFVRNLILALVFLSNLTFAAGVSCVNTAANILGSEFEVVNNHLQPLKSSSVVSFDKSKLNNGNGVIKFKNSNGEGSITYKDGKIVEIGSRGFHDKYSLNSDCSINQNINNKHNLVFYDKTLCQEIAKLTHTDKEKTKECANHFAKINEAFKNRLEQIKPNSFRGDSEPIRDIDSLSKFTDIVSSCTYYASLSLEDQKEGTKLVEEKTSFYAMVMGLTIQETVQKSKESQKSTGVQDKK